MNARRYTALMIVWMACVLSLGAFADRWYYVNVDGEAIRVYRDSYGVPHVHAQTVRGVYYTMGYVVAQDRLTQFENNRRYSDGRLAEMYGDQYTYSDYEHGRDYYTEAERQAQFDAIPEEDKAIIRHYTDGVNAYIDEVLADPEHKLPKEFWDTGIPLTHWRVVDTVSMAINMVRRFGERGAGELDNLALLNQVGQEEFDRQRPLNNPHVLTTIAADEPCNSPGKAGSVSRPAFDKRAFPKVSDNVAAELYEQEHIMAVAAVKVGFPVQLGSYGIAIAPSKSLTGHAMLLGCPSMRIEVPSSPPASANEIDLHGPGIDVAGVNFAGVPGVFLGHSNYIAWTMTSGKADNVDIFVEFLNPADPTQYRFNGEWRQMESRVITIKVHGQADRQFTAYFTVHGPVSYFDYPNNTALSKQRTFWGQEMKGLEAIMAINRAKTLTQWHAAESIMPLGINSVCATVDGDIGYVLAGRFRVPAPGVDPRLPARGDGTQEWARIKDFSENPQCANPTQGYFISCNSKPATWWDNGDIGWFDDAQWGNPFFVYLAGTGTDAVAFEELAGLPQRYNFHGTFEHVTDLIPPFTTAVDVLPPGQSGFIDKSGNQDPHFADQQAMWDNWQRKPFLYFYDSDRDGLMDQEEAYFGTGADMPDTDGDGILDGDEVRDLDLGTQGIQNPFNPLVADSTGNNGVSQYDDALDGYNDFDGDGLSNAAESQRGTNPLVPDRADGVFFTLLPYGGWFREGRAIFMSLRVSTAYTNLEYQWSKDGTDLPGATETWYADPSLTLEDSGDYTCRVTDDLNAVHETPPVTVSVFLEGSLPATNAGALVLLMAVCLTVGVLALRCRWAVGGVDGVD